jgi:uncharacterized membrane protein SpoIIM required for sporulation
MVLESLINPFEAEKKPAYMIFFGFLFATVAIFLSLWVFNVQPSMVMIAIISITCAPIMYSIMKIEERKDIDLETEKTIMKEHLRAILFYLFLFLGLTIAFAFWYLALPNATTSILFNVQTSTISSITGNAAQPTGDFVIILLNNLKVLSFCILFSFLFGLGAIFILAWNASVLGAAIGSFIQTFLSSIVHASSIDFFKAMGCSIIKYFIHGLPEIIGYLFAGLAGAIISFAIINKDFRTKNFQKVLMDVADLLLLALLFLFMAALIEVFVSPIITYSLCF